MRQSNFALGLCAIAGALSALWAFHQLGLEREQRIALEQRLATLQARLDAAPTVAHSQSGQSTRDNSPTAAGLSAVPGAPTTAPPQQDINEHLRESAQREREMLRDPAYRETQMAESRRRFAGVRRDAIRVVGMTPAQADRVVELWVERNLRFMELGGIPGQPPDKDVQAALRRASDAEQEELRTLLGDAKYEEWHRFLASGQERYEIQQLRTELAGTPDALGDAQADTLAMTIYSERERLSREYDDYATSAGITDRNIVRPQDRQRWLELAKEANQRIHAAVAATMTKPQLARLDEMLAARLAPAEAALRLQLEGGLRKE